MAVGVNDAFALEAKLAAITGASGIGQASAKYLMLFLRARHSEIVRDPSLRSR
jgi:NADP-dependent 3-hydroxy acid dehydrogenase YdfG